MRRGRPGFAERHRTEPCRSRPVAEKAEIIAEFNRRAIPKFADRTIVPIIEKVFPLDDVAGAHGMMEEDSHFGKIVLKVS